MTRILPVIVSFVIAAGSLPAQSFEEYGRWKQILGPPRGETPGDPGGEITWRTDFAAALEEAKKNDRPMLVTFRCLPCKQCADFDQNVLEGGARLGPLLRQFVTVRLTDAAQLDERYFPYRDFQDLDLSWWGYFLSQEGDLYGVFGGKDHVSDSTRISEEAFANTMDRVLRHHYDPRRPAWKIDLLAADESVAPSGPKSRRGYRLLRELRPGIENPHAQHGVCLHCHQVGDALNLEQMEDGAFNIRKLTQGWPYPENTGIVLDRDDGLLVKSVEPGSPADEAGLEPGDRLGMANGMRLFGQADFRGVLHRAGYGADEIHVAWIRGDEVQFGVLSVQPGWRESEAHWRKTVYDGVYGPTMGFWPLRGPGAGKGKGLSIKPWMGKKPAERPVYRTGLRPGMEIVAINGMDEDLDARRLITWFRLNHRHGDEVTYTVRIGSGQTKEFRFVLPRPSPE